MRTSVFRLPCSLLVAAAVCLGQTETQLLVDQAQALPAEYSADLLFRLLDSGRVIEPAARREALEGLFTQAGHLQQPVQLDDVVGWTDTRSWSTGRALGQKLDTLSVRCRVVKAMLPMDPPRARQLFLDIVLPAADHPKCTAALAADSSIYYETARELVNRGLLNPEDVLRSINSAGQLAGAVKGLHGAHLTAPALDVYTSRLNELADSPRSIEFAISTVHLPQEVVSLAETSKSQGIAVDGLLGAYRTFLARAAAAERCGDSKLQTAVDSFNDRLRWGGYLAAQDLPRLTEAETKPASMSSRARPDQYWRSPQSKRMLSLIRHLRFGQGATALGAEQKATDEWQAEGQSLLSSLEQWKADQESSSLDSFHERAILYGSLLQLMPDGTLHEQVAQSAIRFLADSGVKTSDAAEWLLELAVLMNMRQPEIAKAVLSSQDPVIALYGKITYQK